MEKISLDTRHTSVLLHELVDSINISPDKQNVIVDGTLGMAGHALHIIAKLHPGDIFIGFDADIRNLELAKQRIEEHLVGEKVTITPEETVQVSAKHINIFLIHANFGTLRSALTSRGIHHITGIYYDLGLSSLHVDEAERGFSFRADGPLDMRFDTRQKLSAKDIVNHYSESELSEIFWKYGEESQSKKIAQAIIHTRKKNPIRTTKELSEILDSVHPHTKIKARIFQALRIEVNGELSMLEQSLQDAVELLKTGGIIYVISFHSLEDRIVKQFFKQESRDCICDDLICSCHHKKQLQIISKKPILPSTEETKQNPRSRSAKARHAKKC